MASDKNPKQHTYKIRIDRADYETTDVTLTGAQLRQLPAPNIGAERDLWLVVPGGTDQKIGSDDSVEIRHGLRLFTAPSHINPGKMGGTSL